MYSLVCQCAVVRTPTGAVRARAPPAPLRCATMRAGRGRRPPGDTPSLDLPRADCRAPAAAPVCGVSVRCLGLDQRCLRNKDALTRLLRSRTPRGPRGHLWGARVWGRPVSVPSKPSAGQKFGRPHGAAVAPFRFRLRPDSRPIATVAFSPRQTSAPPRPVPAARGRQSRGCCRSARRSRSGGARRPRGIAPA